MTCEHGDIRSLCKQFFEMGVQVGRDDTFREEREAAERHPDNVYSFQEFATAKLLRTAPPIPMRHDA